MVLTIATQLSPVYRPLPHELAALPAALPLPPQAGASAAEPAGLLQQQRGLAGMFAGTVLPRHGQRPLQIPARMLLEASSRGGGCDIWSEIAVLETEDGRYIAVLRHQREGRGLPSHHQAEICADVESVRAVFETHDPVSTLPVEGLTGPLPNHAVPEDILALAGREAGFQRMRWRTMIEAVFGAPRHAIHSDPRPGAVSGGLQ